MSITKQQVLEMTLPEIFGNVKSSDPLIARQMQSLIPDRDVAVHISKLMQAKQQEQAEREAELDAQLVRTAPPPSTEELAAEAAVVAVQPDPSVPVPAVEPKKRIVREYQVRDEDGTPIGRPTHLEAYSEAEMLDKMQVAHESATRAFHRLKKQKLQFKEEEQKRILTPAEIQAAATKALEAKDAAEAEKLVRGLLESEFRQKELQLQQQKDFQEGVRIANEFVMKHLYDFNPVRSNMIALTDYLRENSLDLTLDNLEVAFIDLNEQGNKLAPVTGQTKSVEQPTNTVATTVPAVSATSGTPAVEAPVVATPVIAQPVAVSAPVVEATVTTPVAANQPPATRRQGVNGSLPPGSLSVPRLIPIDPAQARREFLQNFKSLSTVEMRKKLNDPQFVKQLNAYGIKAQ